MFHWDLLEQANKDKLALSSKEVILEEGQRNADSRETLMFWINQVRLEWKEIEIEIEMEMEEEIEKKEIEKKSVSSGIHLIL